MDKNSPTVLCLNETKCDTEKLDKMMYFQRIIPGYAQYWNGCTSKKGYSGTAIFTKVRPISVQFDFGTKHNDEGRSITMEFKKFILVATYVPNAGEGLKRLDYRVNQWDVDFTAYLKQLEADRGKPVVLAGDLNVALNELDVYDTKGKHKVPGYTPEERASFTDLLENKGFCDTFRHLYPTTIKYSFWSVRANLRPSNRGWRLDYFLLSQDHESRYGIQLNDSIIDNEQFGSDHCPIALKLTMPDNEDTKEEDPDTEERKDVKEPNSELPSLDSLKIDASTEDKKPAPVKGKRKSKSVVKAVSVNTVSGNKEKKKKQPRRGKSSNK